MNLNELLSRDSVVLDGFEWPAALREAALECPDARPVRVSRQRGDAFATVTLLTSGDETAPMPISLTLGNNQARFGKGRTPVLTITGHGTDAASLIAVLRNAADALQRATDIASQLVHQ